MKRPGLAAALVALVILAGLVVGFERYARALEDRYAHILATTINPQRRLGVAIRQAALRQPDILLMFGSSEVLSGKNYNASVLFQSYPTGFTVSRIGNDAEPLLIITLQIATGGFAWREKKVALVLDQGTISYFTDKWAPNYSTLLGNDLAFNTDLSYALKQRIARRLLKHPEVTEKDMFLRAALERLADDRLISRIAYHALFPLGKMRLWVMHLQDHWEVLTFLANQKNLTDKVTRQPATLDWTGLIEKASAEYSKEVGDNPFRVEAAWWKDNGAGFLKYKNTMSDPAYRKWLQGGALWENIEITFAVLKELGAEPLLLGIPLHGPYEDYRGASVSARALYYEILQQ